MSKTTLHVPNGNHRKAPKLKMFLVRKHSSKSPITKESSNYVADGIPKVIALYLVSTRRVTVVGHHLMNPNVKSDRRNTGNPEGQGTRVMG